MPLNNSSNINAQAGYPLNPYTRAASYAPTIIGSTTAGTGTYTKQGGWYTKIGDMLFVFIDLVWTAHTGTGNMLVRLPLTVSNLTDFEAYGNLNTVNIAQPGGCQDFTVEFLAGTTTARPIGIRSNNTNVPYAIDTAGEIHMSGFYLA